MVLYFSGTGNSEFVARRIAEAVSDEIIDLGEVIRNENIEKHAGRKPESWSTVSEKPVVIVSPVYSWRVPRFLNEWLSVNFKNISGNKDTYFVLTCGDSLGTAWKYAKALSEKTGRNFMGMAKVIMPENYIALFNAPYEEESRAIVRSSEPVILDTIEKIKKGEGLSYEKEPFGWVNSLINPCFYGAIVHDKKFAAGDKCTGCGLCEKLCPLDNIRLISGKPSWNGNCTHCMACICHCPEEAIEYGIKSKGKRRYVLGKNETEA